MLILDDTGNSRELRGLREWAHQGIFNAPIRVIRVIRGYPRLMEVSVLKHCILAALLACLYLAGTASAQPNDYSNPKSWLCRPGGHDACDIDLTTTVVQADGKLTKEKWTADPNAPIDCFYVYPTVSTDPTQNSDMTADAAELNVIRQQFSRFASKCRPYAPLYRQITLAGLRRALAAGGVGGAGALASGIQYDDVRDAWNYYLDHDNKGRGFVLVGQDRKSTRLNSSHLVISYAVFCLKKKKKTVRVRALAVDAALI